MSRRHGQYAAKDKKRDKYLSIARSITKKSMLGRLIEERDALLLLAQERELGSAEGKELNRLCKRINRLIKPRPPQ